MRLLAKVGLLCLKAPCVCLITGYNFVIWLVTRRTAEGSHPYIRGVDAARCIGIFIYQPNVNGLSPSYKPLNS
jgi:hypothetical protein